MHLISSTSSPQLDPTAPRASCVASSIGAISPAVPSEPSGATSKPEGEQEAGGPSKVSSRRLRAVAVAAASVVWPASEVRSRPPRGAAAQAAAAQSAELDAAQLLSTFPQLSGALLSGEHGGGGGGEGPEGATASSAADVAPAGIGASSHTPSHAHLGTVLAAGTPSKCKARAEQPTACRVPPSQWFAANVDWRPTLPGLPPVVSSGLPAPMQGEGASPESPSRASRLKV